MYIILINIRGQKVRVMVHQIVAWVSAENGDYTNESIKAAMSMTDGNSMPVKQSVEEIDKLIQEVYTDYKEI